MIVYRDVEENGAIVQDKIIDIIECTYSGKDMGERSITATFNLSYPVDFKIGDYVELQMHELLRDGTMAGSIEHVERFYIYTMPTIKKTASRDTHGEGFEHIVTFYPAQYELSLVQMRNLGDGVSNDIIYTGFDSFSFVGGAKALMKRIMRVLDEAYGKDTWKYYIANEVDEESNDAIEMVTFSFSGNSVMDALLKLNDKEGVNTTFFINNRTIYVGFKRAYFCRAIDNATIDPDIATQTFNFQYGKTSHENVAIDHGGLFEITKSIGKETPITKLFAYGAYRNLNRYYCSDRIATGRYVNRLMLPSFQNDGKTDFIMSPEVATYGVREGSKTFEEIYPSLRYITYGDIRQVKYCIKIKASGITGDNIEDSAYPIARVQCYRVIESATKGVNTLVEAAPPDDLAIYVRALDKVVKVVLCGGASDGEAISKQLARDAKVPTRDGNSDYIPGSCFLVHDMGFSDTHLEHTTTDRSVWFTNPNDESAMAAFSEEIQTEIKLHQINYTDDFWLTDLYVFTAYNQTYFNRLGYSAWSYPMLNSNYTSRGGDIAHDSVLVNEIIEVEPITIDDTSAGIGGVEKLQHTFDVYLRDIGFKIDEQSDFGNMVFVLNGALKVSFLDGYMIGREFECKFQNSAQSYCVCAYNEDGTLNEAFFEPSKYNDRGIPERAFDNGAIWRLRLERINLDEPDYSNLNLIMPKTIMNAQGGDHIVLLDLFMPDIYIHAAENRLLREARHYLSANDRGKIQYAVAFDKVRMQQIPAYALQMREGLKIRMIDSDLNIATKNRVQQLFEGSLLTRTSLYETTYDSQPAEGYYYTFEHRDYYYLKEKGLIRFGDNGYLQEGGSTFYFKPQNNGDSPFGNASSVVKGTCYIQDISQEDESSNGELFAKDGKVTVRIFDKVRTANGTFYQETKEYRTFDVSNVRKTANGQYVGDCSLPQASFNAFKKSEYDSSTGEYVVRCAVEYDVRFKHTYDYTVYTPNTHLIPRGIEVYAPSKILLEFSQNKHYDITIVARNTDILRVDEKGNPKFVLVNNLSQSALCYTPTTEILYEDIGDGSIRFTFSFDLGSSFNDAQDYYPSLIYVSNNMAEYVETIIESVVESDMAGRNDLDYAEFTIQDVTIKIIDSSNRTFAQPIKEITATLSEQNNASAWGTLLSRVEKTAIESEETAKTSQTIINSARRYYQQLLNLRNSIFDPDGTCNDTFLQVMMLQVGADSMNYYLDNTRQDVDGTPHNYSIAVEDDGLFHFRVYNEDWLHHLVYTDNGGSWHIQGNADFALEPNGDGTHPTYFVAIKCNQYGNNSEWVCSTKQYKVNEEEGFYYFNWGILSADEAGVYTLMETRGNAYMYGDNLVAGRISDIAKKSWFDLTKGEFVLGDNGDGTAALMYANGVLTIGGIPDEETISKTIEKLLGEQSIGGENLFRGINFADWGVYETYKGETWIPKNLRSDTLQAGDYVLTGKAYSSAGGVKAALYAENGNMLKSVMSNPSSSLDKKSTQDNIIITNLGVDLYCKFTVEEPCYLAIVPNTQNTHGAYYKMYLENVMLQRGNKATSYQPYVEHITSALKGTTEIAGGLVMTQALMLKNENDVVTAGMSGLQGSKDNPENVLLWGGGTYKEAVNAAKADNDFYAGENKTGRQITTLLKKDGQGKIGIFKITDTQAVVKTNQGEILIDATDDNGGVYVKNLNGETKVSIKNKEIGNAYIPEVFNKSFTKYLSSNDVLCSGSTGTCITEANAVIWDDMIVTNGRGKNTITVDLGVSFIQMLRYSGDTPRGDTFATVQLVCGSSIIASKSFTLNNVSNDSYFASELLHQQFTFSHTTYDAGVYKLMVYVKSIDHYACLGDFKMQGTITCTWDYEEIVIPQTIFAPDGVLSMYNANHYFMVQNTESEQKIYAKGLGNGANRTPGSGELYVTSSFVDAFVSFLDEFHAYVDHVRTIGSNAGNADAMQNKIEKIKNTLVDASGNRITDIIASS